MILGRAAPAAHVVVPHSNPDRAEAVARTLRPAGHRVTTLTPAANLVATVAAAQPDLVIGSLSLREPASARSCAPCVRRWASSYR